MAIDKLAPLQKKYLSDYGLDDIALDGLSVRHYKKGDFLCEQGFPMDCMLIVTDGKVKVCSMASNGKTLLYCFHDPGTVLGEVEFMTRTAASSSVCAVNDTQCIAIPHDRYREYLTSNIKFMNRISMNMAEIVAETSKNGASNILYPFETRLCAYMSATSENGYFSHKLTELAEFLGTSYRHLLRTLDNLCSRGVIEKTARGYLIKDETKMKTIGNNFYLR